MRLLTVLALVGIFVFVGARVQRACAEDEQRIDNGFFEVKAVNGIIESLRCDPLGKGNYSENFVRLYRFNGLIASASTTCKLKDAKEAKSLKWTSMSAVKEDSVRIENCSVPVPTTDERPIGQTFEVPGEFDCLSIRVPTWHSETSGATIQLLKDGKLIADQKFEVIEDNSKPMLQFEFQPAGKYEVRLVDPKGGMLGWWSTDKDVYAGGAATASGVEDASSDRFLIVPYRLDYCEEAEVEIGIEKSKLTYSLKIPALEKDPGARHEQRMDVYWERDGYDVSAKATPFKRFYSDVQRLMPAEQLKRCAHGDHAFGCNEWFHFDGTGNFDLLVHAPNGSLSWSMTADEMTLHLGPRAVEDESKAKTYSVTFELLPREDAFPTDWPVFETSDKSMNQDLNLMHYERNFTYPSPCGPAPWIEWSAISRAWIDGPMGDGDKKHLLGTVMDDEGYVCTWGGSPGWPFPDNKVYDTRHFDTNARFIMAVWRHVLWSMDLDYLEKQMPRLRKAMEYQLKTLQGETGLIVAASKDVNGKHRGVGNNYWDILPFGHLDAYANAIYFASLEAMAQLEELFEENVRKDKKDLVSGEIPGHYPAFYRVIRKKTKDAYTEKFWDEKEGRFIGCIDIDGNKHDYGFTFVNLEAMYYGVASPDQARRIYDWMENGKSSSGEADIYSKWVFAPRATTIHNPPWNNDNPDGIGGGPVKSWWHFGWLGTPFEEQCQDGGAINRLIFRSAMFIGNFYK